MNLQAQSKTNSKDMGSCNYRVTYTYKFLNDTIKKESYYDRQVLEIGDSIVKYSSVYAAKIDSVDIAFSNKKTRPNKSGADGYNAHKEAGLKPNEKEVRENYYMNYPEKKTLTVLTRIGVFFSVYYLYEEATPNFNWQYQSDTATILGYKCMKATATFRGRTYNAWFTPFLPLRYGPWKFNGLPGLVLKVADTEEFFEWTAIGIEKPQNKDIYIPDFEKISAKILVRTDRKSVIKLLHKRWQDPVGLGLASLPDDFKGAWTTTDPVTGKRATVSHVMPIEKNIQFSYIPIPELE